MIHLGRWSSRQMCKDLDEFSGHDNVYVHFYIRRTSLFCGSFKEQPRKIIPKRFVWHFISAHVGSWLDELFRKCSSMRWDDCWDHNMIQWAVHTKSNCLLRPIRLSVRTQDSQSWKSSSILLWATIIYCGVEQW